ncbi:MAG: hypothetical protein B7Z30_00335 [Rhizobiales bacterium 12-68-15]|nr:MAG: hypothetical protein B7Z30_00335 [Rhizobiales bacterium 12-68-15]
MHRHSQEGPSHAGDVQHSQISPHSRSQQAELGLRTEACRLPASGGGLRTEACRLPASGGQSIDRPDLSSLTLHQQHQMRRADPWRDQQQRDHQRGLC